MVLKLRLYYQSFKMEKRQTSILTGLITEVTNYGSGDHYNDPACGNYGVSDLVVSELKGNESRKRKIAKVLATRKLRYGNPKVFIADNGNLQVTDRGFTKRTVDSLLSEYPKDLPSVIDEALINLSKLVEEPSQGIEITELERWYLYAHDEQSQSYNLEQLLNFEYIKLVEGDLDGGAIDLKSPLIRIETKGWKRIQEINANSKDSKKVFVAMWFDQSMNKFYDNAIQPALEFLDYQPIRIDKEEHNNKICDQIIAEIRKSRFVIADFTGSRGGVYFEAGYAQGLGIPVIWTVSKEFFDKDGIHFDTRQYNHIIYEDVQDLSAKLINRIEATIHK